MTTDKQAAFDAIDTFVDDYVESYVLDDGECYHEPTEHERFLIEDAINGLIADHQFEELMAATLAAERDALRAEVERLTGCLKRANDQAEHFERHWYLRGDEVEALRADAERLRAENAELAGERLAERLKEAEAAAQAGRVEMLTALEKVRRDVGSLVQERDALRALNSMLRAELQSTKDALRAEVEQLRAPVARPLAEWHEDMGPALWWHMPVEEGPWFGQPTDADWPGYHTHWTTCAVPLRASDDDASAAQEGQG